MESSFFSVPGYSLLQASIPSAARGASKAPEGRDELANAVEHHLGGSPVLDTRGALVAVGEERPKDLLVGDVGIGDGGHTLVAVGLDVNVAHLSPDEFVTIGERPPAA